MFFRLSVYRISVFFLIAFLVAGCLTEPNIRMPKTPPDIVKTYKHLAVMGGQIGLKDTGVLIEEGDVYTVLVTGHLNYCPRGGCKWQKVTPAGGFIARVGEPETSIYFKPMSDYYNANHFTRTQYNESGNLYIGYKASSVDSSGHPYNIQWLQDDIGSYSVDIIVWQTDDWIKIADFLEKQVKNYPESSALKEAFTDAAKFRKIELAKEETNKALEKTKQQLAAVTQQTEQNIALDNRPADIQRPTQATDPASRHKIVQLEAQLKKLTLMLAGLDDMKQQLSAERQKSEKLAAELDQSEEREKDLRTRLEDGSRRRPVIVIASPKSQTRTESGRITLSGVAQDDGGIVEFEILVNGMPLGAVAERGLKVAGAPSAPSVEFSDSVALIKGENRIQIRAVDTDGMVTVKNLVIHRLEIRRNVWAVVIGINSYTNVAPLSYAVNDARDFYQVLVEKTAYRLRMSPCYWMDRPV